MEALRSKCKTLIDKINCFGWRDRERHLVVEVDEPSKGLKIQGKVVKEDDGSSDDFWSTSPCNMVHNSTTGFQSSDMPTDPQCSTSNSTEFVNHGLVLWNQTRKQWCKRSTRPQSRVPEPAISWNTTYDSLLNTNKPFPRPIPLQDMVHFLVEVWDEEGLYV